MLISLKRSLKRSSTTSSLAPDDERSSIVHDKAVLIPSCQRLASLRADIRLARRLSFARSLVAVARAIRLWMIFSARDGNAIRSTAVSLLVTVARRRGWRLAGDPPGGVLMPSSASGAVFVSAVEPLNMVSIFRFASVPRRFANVAVR